MTKLLDYFCRVVSFLKKISHRENHHTMIMINLCISSYRLFKEEDQDKRTLDVLIVSRYPAADILLGIAIPKFEDRLQTCWQSAVHLWKRRICRNRGNA